MMNSALATGPRTRDDDVRRALQADLDSARQLYRTFDPDSPPWAIEPEIRRLEQQLARVGGGSTSRPRAD